MPFFLWNRLNNSSGGDLEKIRDIVIQAQHAETEQAKTLKMDEAVAYFENWVTGYRSYDRKLGKYSALILQVFFCFGKKSGNYLSSLYLFMKFLNILNVLCSFLMLSVFLNLNYWAYGFTVVESVLNYGDWQDSHFPRLLICDFVMESSLVSNASAVAHKEYNIQCSMTLNLLLEKVFAVEWFWMVFLLIVSIINALVWAVRIKPPCSTILFSKCYIDACACVEAGVASIANPTAATNLPVISEREFIEMYLRSDGVFVLRVLELNTDRTLVAELIKPLWNRYRQMKNCNLFNTPNYKISKPGEAFRHSQSEDSL